ncbi:unnamed protein product [Sphagnum jensenii]|uniref:non-specific serine/threonine protein kinase n=1 Tax=Sphagnum jensenii TaxID=128206 RepID=A0ABP1BKF5_9BRYO
MVVAAVAVARQEDEEWKSCCCTEEEEEEEEEEERNQRRSLLENVLLEKKSSIKPVAVVVKKKQKGVVDRGGGFERRAWNLAAAASSEEDVKKSSAFDNNNNSNSSSSLLQVSLSLLSSGRSCSSSYVQSPSSSIDLSSSSPSFKSSLSSSNSNYGSSSQERESEGERWREGGGEGMKKPVTTTTTTTAVDAAASGKQTSNEEEPQRTELTRDEHGEEARKRESERRESERGVLAREDEEKERGNYDFRDSGRDSDRRDSSRKLSGSRASNGSDSNESSCSSLGYGGSKPHKANDKRWEGIQAIRVRDGSLGLSHFKLLKRLGCGDIGSVYLAELRGSHSHFAMKVMDKASLASRKKLLRAQTEREILQSLDHPFLPTLYTHFESDKFLCLVMEFCSGGDLHILRQQQPGKHFSELAARFYAAEILLALEYLHMMGVVYRDLKPENVLVREDGHIMLSDFDLSLKCAVSPTLVKSSAGDSHDGGRRGGVQGYCIQPVSCAEPSCVVPSCVGPVGALSCVTPSCFVMKSSLPSLLPSFVKKKKDAKNGKAGTLNVTSLPELIAEPTGARSMSFVGTHEYLAPEIIKGDGHGSAVDWWTFGIFLYELLFGKTPFKGSGNRATLLNVVWQPLKFPESATGQVSFAARDLIRGLLVKEPLHRLASKRGAAEIKAHPFFEGVNFALIRCTSPPEVPRPFELGTPASNSSPAEDVSARGSYLDFDFF